MVQVKYVAITYQSLFKFHKAVFWSLPKERLTVIWWHDMRLPS